MRVDKPEWVSHEGQSLLSVDVHPDGSREIRSFVPHARLCMHPSAGHAIPIELSEYCAKKINEFHSDVGDGTVR